MSKSTGRLLVARGYTAEKPTSVDELIKEVERRNEKSYSRREAQIALNSLRDGNILDNELDLTDEGKRVFALMCKHSAKGERFHKYFRPSETPNIGPRAAPRKVPSPHLADPGLLRVS